jgi:hypothetical protein
MNSVEIDRIVSQHEGRLCARYYQRPDGTMLTQNCPVGFRFAVRRVSRMAGAALTAFMSVGPAMAGPRFPKSNESLLQIQPAQVGLTLEVVDPSGAVVPKAHVTVVNEETKAETDAETDATGRLHIADLPPGTYEVTVTVPGFNTLKEVHLTVPTRETLKLQLALSVLMGEVVVVGIETEASPISGYLSAPLQAQSTRVDLPAHRPNAVRRLFSAFRRIF